MKMHEQLKTHTNGETVARFVENRLQRPVLYVPNVEPNPHRPETTETGIYSVGQNPTLTQLTTALLQVPHTAVWICPPPAEPVPDGVFLIPAPSPKTCQELNRLWEPLRQCLRSLNLETLLTEDNQPNEPVIDLLIQTEPPLQQLEHLAQNDPFVQGYFTALNETLARKKSLRVAWLINPEVFHAMKDPGYRLLMHFIMSYHMAFQIWLIQGGWRPQYHA